MVMKSESENFLNLLMNRALVLRGFWDLVRCCDAALLIRTGRNTTYLLGFASLNPTYESDSPLPSPQSPVPILNFGYPPQRVTEQDL